MLFYWEPIIWSTVFFFKPHIFNFSFIFFACLLGYFLFFFGIIGLIIRQFSLIFILIAIELFFLGSNLIFLFLGFLLFQPFLQIVVLLLLTLAAAEAVVLLSIIFFYHRNFQTTDLSLLQILHF